MLKYALVLSFVILVLAGCQQQPVCGDNYYEFKKGECCIDTNKNRLCDVDEKTAEKAPVDEKEVSPSSLSAGKIYQNSRDSLYMVVVNCTYNLEFDDFSIDSRAINGVMDIELMPLDGKIKVPRSRVFTASAFEIDEGLLTNFHSVQCSDELILEEELMIFEDNLQIYSDGFLMDSTRMPVVDTSKYEEAVNALERNKAVVPAYRSESYAIKVVSSHIISSSKIKEVEKTIYALHENSGFGVKERIYIDEAGRDFPGKDFAILSHKSEKPIKVTDDNKFEIGQKVYVVGFPAISLQEVEDYYNSAPIPKDPPIITSGILGNEITSSQNVKYFVLDASAYSGSSGGPVLNSNGEVIGILTAGLADIGEFTYTLPIYETTVGKTE